MKNLFIALALALGACCSALAQNTKPVKGFVVDKNGNPIAGAEVIATGGGDVSITDSDGSFSMSVSPFLKTLTASYGGMQPNKKKVKFDRDIVFTLKPVKKHPFFLDVTVGYAQYNYGGYGDAGVPIGLMFGQLGKWGWYFKANGQPDFFDLDLYSNASVTAGAIKSIYQSKLYGYVGLGYGYAEGWETYGNSGVSLDFGLIYRPINHFNLTLCFNPQIYRNVEYYDWDWSHYTSSNATLYGITLGFGYVF